MIVILEGFVEGLIVAWFLSLFGIHNMVLEVLQPLTKVALTNSHYYLLFGLIGLISGAFRNKYIYF